MGQISWYLKFLSTHTSWIIIQQILTAFPVLLPLSLLLPQWHWAWPFYVLWPREYGNKWSACSRLRPYELWSVYTCHSGSCQLCHEKNRLWETNGPIRRRNMQNKHEGNLQPEAEPSQATSRPVSKKQTLIFICYSYWVIGCYAALLYQ